MVELLAKKTPDKLRCQLCFPKANRYKIALPTYVNKTNSNIARERTVNSSIKFVSVVESVYTTDLKSAAYLRVSIQVPPLTPTFCERAVNTGTYALDIYYTFPDKPNDSLNTKIGYCIY